MANVIKHKRGSGSDPVASDLVVGEVAIRTDVGKLFTKMDNGSVAEIAGGGSDIAINTLSSSSATGGGSATFNGSAYRFTLSAPPSVSAQQLLVSINGVIQKPVAGTGQPSEGFSVDGTDIILGDAPATGSDFFILTFKSLGVSEPADNSVTSAKIVDGAIVNADINASAAIAKTKIETFVNNNGTTRLITGTNNVNELDAETNLTVNGSTITFAESTLTVSKSTLATVSAKETAGNKEIALRANTTGGVLRTIGSYPLIFEIAQAEKLRIDSSGRLLLGTTTVGESTADDLTIATSGSTGITIRAGTSNASNILFADGTSGDDAQRGIVQYHHSDNSMRLFTDATRRMTIDSSGKVGIGTSSPSVKTQISVSDTTAYSASTISANQFQLSITNTGAAGVAGLLFVTEPSSGNGGHCGIRALSTGSGDSALTFSTRGSSTQAERLRIDSSGNVGIGTTSPSSLLHVDGDVTIKDASPSILFSDDAGVPQNPDYKIQVNTGNFVINDDTNSATRLLIDSSGNVGIGTTSPTGKFAVSDGTTEGEINPSGGICYIGTRSNHPVTLLTNATGRMTIDTSGRLLVGTTTQGSTSGDDLTIATSGTTGITLRSGSTNNGNILFADGTSGDAQSRGVVQYAHSDNSMRLFTNATERMRIDSSGNVSIGSTSSVAPLNVKAETDGNLHVRPIGSIASAPAGSGVGLDVLNDANNAVKDLALRGSTTIFKNASAESMRIDSSGDVLIGTTSAVTDTKFVVDGNIAQKNTDTGTGAIVKKFVVSRDYSMSTTTVAVLKLDNWGTSAFEITAFRRDTSSPHGAEVTKLYLGVQGSGSNMTSVALVQETKVTRGSIHTATYSAADNGNFVTISVTGDDNGGEAQKLVFYVVATGGNDGEVSVQ